MLVDADMEAVGLSVLFVENCAYFGPLRLSKTSYSHPLNLDQKSLTVSNSGRRFGSRVVARAVLEMILALRQRITAPSRPEPDGQGRRRCKTFLPGLRYCDFESPSSYLVLEACCLRPIVETLMLRENSIMHVYVEKTIPKGTRNSVALRTHLVYSDKDIDRTLAMVFTLLPFTFVPRAPLHQHLSPAREALAPTPPIFSHAAFASFS